MQNFLISLVNKYYQYTNILSIIKVLLYLVNIKHLESGNDTFQDVDEMPQAEELTARVQFKHLESGNDTFQDVDELTQAENFI